MKELSTKPSDAKEGISSELSYTEARGALQAANSAAAAATELGRAAGTDVPRPQPSLRGQ